MKEENRKKLKDKIKNMENNRQKKIKNKISINNLEKIKKQLNIQDIEIVNNEDLKNLDLKPIEHLENIEDSEDDDLLKNVKDMWEMVDIMKKYVDTDEMRKFKKDQYLKYTIENTKKFKKLFDINKNLFYKISDNHIRT